MTDTPIYMPESEEAEKEQYIQRLRNELDLLNGELEDMYIAITGTATTKKRKMLKTIIKKRPDLADDAIATYGAICYTMAQIMENGGRIA